jgi:hypothetical protein
MYEQFGYADYFTLFGGIQRYTKVGQYLRLIDGVASNFADDQYIALNPVTITVPFEIDFGKVTTGSDVSVMNTLLGCTSTSDSSEGMFRIKINDMHQWQVLGDNNISTGLTATANTDYYIKAGDNGTKFYLSISTDGTNYTTYYSSSRYPTSYPYKWRIGNDGGYDEWTGSVDIYNTSITYGGVTYPLYEAPNFTTPQGSTYGYLQKLTRQNVTDTSSTTITLAKAKGNTDYHYGTLTSLTITANETSDYETNIYFTAGNSISVSLPATLDYIGTTPSFSASTSYVMSILNNILVVGEIA